MVLHNSCLVRFRKNEDKCVTFLLDFCAHFIIDFLSRERRKKTRNPEFQKKVQVGGVTKAY